MFPSKVGSEESLGAAIELAPLPSRLSGRHLRGLPYEASLTCFGHLWAESLGTTASYQQSVQVPWLDDFISHSWRTHRAWKFLALCLHYNVDVAIVIGLVHAVALGVLEGTTFPHQLLTNRKVQVAGRTENLKIGAVSATCGPAMFLLLLFFWHDLPRCMRPKRHVFVDKACIHQTDPVEKAAGIRGLAGFLRKSTNLVILWTPDTFSRMWCSYELAMWLILGQPISHIFLLPVSQATAVICAFSAVWATVLFAKLADVWTHELGYLHFLFVVLTVFVAMPHFLRNLHAFGQLVPASNTFLMQYANCYCCSVNHKDPVSGDELLCDRQLIYETIRAWQEARAEGEFQECASEYRDSTWYFANRCVRSGAGRVATQALGDGSLFSPKVIFVGIFPYFCHCVDLTVASRFFTEWVARVRWHLSCLSWTFLLLPLVFNAMTSMATCLVEITWFVPVCGERMDMNVVKPALVTICTVVFAGVGMGCHTLALRQASIVPQLLDIAANAVVLCLLRRWARGRGQRMMGHVLTE